MRLKIRTYFILAAGTLISMSLLGQQDAMFTHYMFNTLWLNPAYAGSRDALTITGIHRSQWVGYSGAPIDQSLTMHAPFLKGKAGIGLSFLNDRIGPVKNTLTAIDLSYRIKLNSKSRLAFGIKGLADFYQNTITSLNLDQQNDAAFAQNVRTITPNVGLGLYYYGERFYAGFSIPRLLKNNLDQGITEQTHFYLIAGTVLTINRLMKLKPTVFVKATKGAPVQADLTATFILQDRFNAGIMYRTREALGCLIGYNCTEQLYLGYSFDWSIINTTGKYNSGSHEIVLRYDLIYRSETKIKSPRFF